MDCKRFVELMSEYVDGNLPEEDARLFEKHFRDCKDCGPFFKSFTSSLELCKKVQEKQCPQEVSFRMSNLLAELCDQKQTEA